MYVDRTNKAGSQKQLAFLTYKTMELVIEKDCPSDLAEQIKEDAAFPQGLKEMDDHLKALTMGRILDCNTVTREGPNLILSKDHNQIIINALNQAKLEDLTEFAADVIREKGKNPDDYFSVTGFPVLKIHLETVKTIIAEVRAEYENPRE